MSAGGQLLGIGEAVVDAQVIEVLEVVHILAGDGGGALGPDIALLLVVVLQVGHVAGEAPGGGAVHVAGGEGVKAQLGGTGVDVLGHGLQAVKVGDLVHGVAGLLHQIGVDDDAVALVAVADGHQLAGLVIEVVGVGVQLVGNSGAGEVHGVVGPVLHAGLVADDEQGGGIGLIHLRVELLVVGAGGGGDHLDLHAGLLGVELGHVLEHLVGLGLEVEPVDGAGGGGLAVVGSGGIAVRGGGVGVGGVGVGGAAAVLAAAAGQQGQGHDGSQCQCQ